MRMQSEWIVRMNTDGGAALPWRSVADGPPLSQTDPAILVVTDFTREHPVTVEDDRQIDDALQDMIRLGVRSLLVHKEQRIVGLITSYDIQGERPIQFLQNSNFSRHGDIRVGDIMTPWAKLVGVDWVRLQSVDIGDVLGLFKDTGLTHLLVLEANQGGSRTVLRGLISRARIERRLVALRRAG